MLDFTACERLNSAMDRRTFLRHSSAALATAAFSSCSTGAEIPTLHVFTWSDYLDPALQQKFETLHKCKVVIHTFDSNESMFAKIKGGAAGYDVLVPSSYMVKALVRENLLLKLDHSKLSRLKNIDAGHLSKSLDPKMEYSVPYMSAPTCVAYLGSKLGNIEPSYSIFTNATAKGRTTLLNDMREVIGAALLSLGFSMNSVDSDEIAKASQVVIEWKKNIAKFDNEQYKSGIASGEFFVVQGYAGELITIAAENEDVQVFIPKEGSASSCDDLCIPANAPNPALAMEWIDFLCEAEIAAQNMEYIGYRAPNSAAYRLLSEDFRGNQILFPDDEALFAKCVPIDDIGDNVTVWSAAWDQIKAS
ncbi:MAG TPA: spermidine/putrescine ABC transporter substrate-binding protein [Verrucomicrobiales bacterium]|nr:spermidine/putrescine ABC transporter substrate-binding protein [Verrucomicrobiales bacterium]